MEVNRKTDSCLLERGTMERGLFNDSAADTSEREGVHRFKELLSENPEFMRFLSNAFQEKKANSKSPSDSISPSNTICTGDNVLVTKDKLTKIPDSIKLHYKQPREKQYEGGKDNPKYKEDYKGWQETHKTMQPFFDYALNHIKNVDRITAMKEHPTTVEKLKYFGAYDNNVKLTLKTKLSDAMFKKAHWLNDAGSSKNNVFWGYISRRISADINALNKARKKEEMKEIQEEELNDNSTVVSTTDEIDKGKTEVNKKLLAELRLVSIHFARRI